KGCQDRARSAPPAHRADRVESSLPDPARAAKMAGSSPAKVASRQVPRLRTQLPQQNEPIPATNLLGVFSSSFQPPKRCLAVARALVHDLKGRTPVLPPSHSPLPRRVLFAGLRQKSARSFPFEPSRSPLESAASKVVHTGDKPSDTSPDSKARLRQYRIEIGQDNG